MSDSTPPLADTKSKKTAAAEDVSTPPDTAGEPVDSTPIGASITGDPSDTDAVDGTITPEPEVTEQVEEAPAPSDGGGASPIGAAPADASNESEVPVGPTVPGSDGTNPEGAPTDEPASEASDEPAPETEPEPESEPASTVSDEPADEPAATDGEPVGATTDHPDGPADPTPVGGPVDSTEAGSPVVGARDSSSTPSVDEGVGTTEDGPYASGSTAVPDAAIGSGDPVTDPGSPIEAPPVGDEVAPEPDPDVAVQVDTDVRDEAGTGAVSNEVYYGDPDDLPEAPDPAAPDAVAGQPTSTFPQATDPAAVRQPASGVPANAYIEPGYRYGGVPIVDTPDTDELRGGSGTAIVDRDVDHDAAFGPTSDGTEPLGEEKRTARVHELEDQKRDQVNASTLDPDAGDTAAPQGDLENPEPVGTLFDVVEVRKVTSYIELVTELGLGISFIELAAANDVVNQRYELYPGDRVRIPKPNQPARVDGVDYDGDDDSQ